MASTFWGHRHSRQWRPCPECKHDFYVTPQWEKCYNCARRERDRKKKSAQAA